MRQILLFVIIFLSSILQGQDCDDLIGNWTNDLGSVLVIDSLGNDGSINGKYASSTGVDGKVFPLVGWINRSEDHPDEINISFTVRWKGYGSITAWTGYCISGDHEAQIITIWNLVRSGKDFDWERIITNASTFRSDGK